VVHAWPKAFLGGLPFSTIKSATQTKNIENNPMQSSQGVAGMDGFGDPAKAFDTSGKSPALLYHRAVV
jgi:hypothetical protein